MPFLTFAENSEVDRLTTTVTTTVVSFNIFYEYHAIPDRHNKYEASIILQIGVNPLNFSSEKELLSLSE